MPEINLSTVYYGYPLAAWLFPAVIVAAYLIIWWIKKAANG